MGRVIAPLSIFLLACATASAQGPAQSSARYTVRGSVVNSVTGEAIRRALVETMCPQATRAFTGSDGQFQFEGLPGGTFVVVARRPGFMEEGIAFARQATSPSGTQTFTAAGNVTVGPDTGAIVIKLVPQSRISGRVLDADGEPVANLTVQCLQQDIVGGHKHWGRAQSVNTDEGGNFLIDDLPPGTVLIESLQKQVYPGLIADDNATRLIYRRQYYPNAPDIGAAQTIDLGPGEDRHVEFTVSALRGTRVFFSVAPAQQWVSAMLKDANGETLEPQVRRNNRTGGWILPSVPPGSWTLTVNSNVGEELSGEAPIEVGNEDVANVVVRLSGPVQAPVVVSGGTNAVGATVPVNIQVLSSSPGMWPSGHPATLTRDGHLAVQRLTPGAYHVTASATGSDCIDSITSGSSDLGRTDYVISAGSSPQPINIALRSDCASLEVTATGRNQNATAVIAGGPTVSEPQVVFAGFGAAQVVKLSPGDYQVFAFSDLTKVEYANPEVLKRFSGQHVSLSPNQKVTVSVDVNVTGASR